jgi:hypothetical protein
MASDHDDPIEAGMWLANMGRYEEALSTVPETYKEWQAKFAGDRVSIEAMLNHRHIHYLFLAAPEPTPEVIQQLGLLLRDMWMAKLSRDFPDRQFVVAVSDGDDPEITFYTERRDG